MRLVDLLDDAGRRAEGVVHGACRNQLVPKVQNWFRSAQPWVTQLGALRRNEKGAV
jgi:hypothetical protein